MPEASLGRNGCFTPLNHWSGGTQESFVIRDTCGQAGPGPRLRPACSGSPSEVFPAAKVNVPVYKLQRLHLQSYRNGVTSMKLYVLSALQNTLETPVG